MKFMKYLLVLALATFAMARPSNAQTIKFLGGGSSALFLELGQAASTLSDTGCLWSATSSSSIEAEDDRPASPVFEQGNIWVSWGPGTGTCSAPVAPFNVYSYMQLDSVVGDRCFFGVDSTGVPGCSQVLTVTAGTTGAGLLAEGSNFNDTAGGIPGNVISAINGANFFVAGTDIRPEDAKFAVQRMFTACTSSILREPYIQTVYQTGGLGYQTSTPNVGQAVLSSFSGKSFNVLQFNIAGNDPFSGKPVPAYTVSTVGAQPIVVTVAPTPASGTGIGAANDIQAFALALFLQGTLGRATDLVGPTSANAVTTLIREPLSGTYNTMEYSNPNSAQFKTSQDASNCNSSNGTAKTNPLNVPSANGAVSGAARKRVIGTGEMVSTIQGAATDTLGYFFWSAANAKAFTATNGKYLTVNGIDPLQNSYSGGTFPTAAAGNLGNVTFANLNSGDYPIWSALRLVSTSPTPSGVTAVIAAAQTLDSTQHDFITLANLKVWHSHFNIQTLGITNEANGNQTLGGVSLCPSGNVEGGGDAGGTNVTVVANHDFCSDFGNKIGLVNKNN